MSSTFPALSPITGDLFRTSPTLCSLDHKTMEEEEEEEEWEEEEEEEGDNDKEEKGGENF